MPGSIISGVRIVARVLSAVQVVTMSAPRTASAVERARIDAEAAAGEVGAELVDGLGIDVEDADFLDAEQRLEGERLELGLRAGADQRHDAAVGAGEGHRGDARRSRRCGGR